MAATMYVAQLLAGQGHHVLLAGPHGAGKSLALQGLAADVPADQGMALVSCNAGTRPHRVQKALGQHMEASTKVGLGLRFNPEPRSSALGARDPGGCGGVVGVVGLLGLVLAAVRVQRAPHAGS